MKNLTLFLAFILMQLSFAQNKVLKVKGTHYIDFNTQYTKSPPYKEIILTPGSELIIAVSVIVNERLWANSQDIKIKFEGAGELLIKGNTNIKNSKIIQLPEKILLNKAVQLTGIKDMEHIQLWDLDGRLIFDDKFYKIKYKEIECKRYDVRVIGRGFRNNYLIGRK